MIQCHQLPLSRPPRYEDNRVTMQATIESLPPFTLPDSSYQLCRRHHRRRDLSTLATKIAPKAGGSRDADPEPVLLGGRVFALHGLG